MSWFSVVGDEPFEQQEPWRTRRPGGELRNWSNDFPALMAEPVHCLHPRPEVLPGVISAVEDSELVVLPAWPSHL